MAVSMKRFESDLLRKLVISLVFISGISSIAQADEGFEAEADAYVVTAPEGQAAAAMVGAQRVGRTRSYLVKEGSASAASIGHAARTIKRYSSLESRFCSEFKARNPGSECERNQVYRKGNTPNDTYYRQQWGMQKIHADTAWDRSPGSASVVVAIIDTGVDYTHPELAQNMWVNTGEIADNGIDDDNNGYIDDIYGWNFAYDNNDPMDDNEHGTHVAGVIGAVGNNGTGIAGLNWNVQIMALKFLDANGSGFLSDAIKAISYAKMMGVKVTNNSWGGGSFSRALYTAIADSNSLFIAAAGNDGINNDKYLSYPASYALDNVISVAAIGRNNRLAYFSNFGKITVDIAAPGVGIYSTVPGGYASLSGTSMATPHVTGASALAISLHPDYSPSEIKDYILNTLSRKSSVLRYTVAKGRTLDLINLN